VNLFLVSYESLLRGFSILEISYLIASVTFIFGLKMLSHPDTARKGNLYAAAGMALAILTTILFHREKETGENIHNLGWIIAAMIVGTGIGYQMAMKVKMTAMPQMVSFFNGMGGACAAAISLIEYNSHHPTETGMLITIFVGLMIGAVSFAGSMIAFGKLDGRIKDKLLPAQQLINNGLLFLIVGLIIFTIAKPDAMGDTSLWIIFGLSLVYGVLFVMPIGGADMPVVISLLNSFTGVAAAFGGFLYSNQVMLTGGILVGSAGTILTILMCKAMNRSLWNVLIGAFGATGGGGSAKSIGDKSVREIGVTDLAILLSYSKKVIVVPGYGLAVAQAQHTLHELERVLEEKGVEVSYAIHPVAGRMPGHMNVLLAEADVPYDRMKEMDEINPEFKSTDVVLVIGANDVVNPAAKTDPQSPIYGMPILDVEDAHHIVVFKRSMAAGYAGIDNELFYNPKNKMFFGDAKASIQKLLAEVKNV